MSGSPGVFLIIIHPTRVLHNALDYTKAFLPIPNGIIHKYLTTSYNWGFLRFVVPLISKILNIFVCFPLSWLLYLWCVYNFVQLCILCKCETILELTIVLYQYRNNPLILHQWWVLQTKSNFCKCNSTYSNHLLSSNFLQLAILQMNSGFASISTLYIRRY